jgi:uncharacterized membrane protein
MFGFFIFVIAFNIFCSLALMDENKDNVVFTILLGALSGVICYGASYYIIQVFWFFIHTIRGY